MQDRIGQLIDHRIRVAGWFWGLRFTPITFAGSAPARKLSRRSGGGLPIFSTLWSNPLGGEHPKQRLAHVADGAVTLFRVALASSCNERRSLPSSMRAAEYG